MEMLLKTGQMAYRLGSDAISIGPGNCQHRYRGMRGSESAPNAFRVLITLMTPVDQSVEIRCGSWSAVTESLEYT